MDKQIVAGILIVGMSLIGIEVLGPEVILTAVTYIGVGVGIVAAVGLGVAGFLIQAEEEAAAKEYFDRFNGTSCPVPA